VWNWQRNGVQPAAAAHYRVSLQRQESALAWRAEVPDRGACPRVNPTRNNQA